jgi:hypothetical protein
MGGGVPVDDAFLDEGEEAVADLPEQFPRLWFCQLRGIGEEALQVRVAEFLDDVVVVAALHDVQHVDDVIRLQKLQNLDFGEEGGLQVLVVVDCIAEGVPMDFSSTFTATDCLVLSCSPR